MKNTSARDAVLALLPRNADGAEIGVWKGDFAARILVTATPRRLHLIDPWERREEDRYRKAKYGTVRGRNIEAVHRGVLRRFADEIAGDTVQVHRDMSRNVLSTMPPDTLDFIYIDGDHLFEAVRDDLDYGFRVVRSGGVLILDDYVRGHWWGDGVIRAANGFLGRHATRCEVVFCDGAQLVIGKF